MCRLLAYVGPDTLISHVVLWPARSIIKQSYDAKERQTDSTLPLHLRYGNLNGDGFGIGWYPPTRNGGKNKEVDHTPCTFTSVTPAWNNDNLNRLATKLESGLIFAHVRAAYPGMPVSNQNCHPFTFGNYMFMHNGVIAGFMEIRRRLLETLSDQAYNAVQSFHSDSAVSFAVFLNHLPNMTEPLTPEIILKAIQDTIATISRIQEEEGITATSLLNYVVTDGVSLVATRYVSNDIDQPASLYFAEGESFQRMKRYEKDSSLTGPLADAVTEEADYHLGYNGTGTRVCIVASEPVTTAASDWAEVPRNTALIVCREKGPTLCVIQSQLCSKGAHPRQEEVTRSLEAATGAAAILPAIRSGLSFATEDEFPTSARKHGRQTPVINRADSSKISQDEVYPRHNDVHAAGAVNSHADRLTGHTGSVVCLCTDGGDLLFSGSVDCTIKVWSISECKLLTTLTGHRDPLRQLLYHQGYLYSAGAKTVRVWSVPGYECRSVMLVGDLNGSIRALTATGTPLNQQCYVGGQDCKVKRYDVDTVVEGGINSVDSPKAIKSCQTLRSTLQAADAPTVVSPPPSDHCASVMSLAICGDYVCSGSSDSTIRVWKKDTLEFVKTLRGHRGSVLALHAVPGLLLSGGRDNLIRVWDSETLVCRKTLGGHRDDVLCISSCLLPVESEPFASPQTKLTSVPSLPISYETMGAETANTTDMLEPSSPTFAGGAKTLFFASSSADGSIRLWNAKCYSCIHTFSSERLLGGVVSVPLSCAVTPSLVIAGLPDGSIALHALEEIINHQQQASTAITTTEDASRAKRVKLDVGTKTAGCEDGRGPLPVSSVNKLDREFEKTLRTFIRIKTVSADPDSHEDCFRGAKFLLRLLESMGAEVKLSQPVEGRNPVVLGRIGSDSSKPTVTCYGHYDVQPAMEPDWTTNPFEVTAIDGYLYGRGVSDNKGPILGFVYAVRELLEQGDGGTSLPVNVVFLFEGEEENGSKGFKEAVMQNIRWFEGTCAVLISNTLWVGEDQPCITYGMRGMISLSIEVRGPTKDLHSGNDGGVISEPLTDLCRVLSTLSDSHHVQIPGFYDSVKPDSLQAALERLEGTHEFSLEGYRKSLGVDKFSTGLSERELLAARWSLPTLSVVDVRVGTAEDADCAHYRFGPTRFSVIPKAAVGKVSIRFVPDQDADHLVDRLTQHVKHEFAKLGSGNEISIRVHNIGDWWEANLQSNLVKMAEVAVEKEWGVKPLLVKEGGTMPVASALEKMLQAPALLLPMGQSSDGCHLSNERMRKINLIRGKAVIKNLLEALAGFPAAATIAANGGGGGETQ